MSQSLTKLESKPSEKVSFHFPGMYSGTLGIGLLKHKIEFINWNINIRNRKVSMFFNNTLNLYIHFNK